MIGLLVCFLLIIGIQLFWVYLEIKNDNQIETRANPANYQVKEVSFKDRKKPFYYAMYKTPSNTWVYIQQNYSTAPFEFKTQRYACAAASRRAYNAELEFEHQEAIRNAKVVSCDAH